MVNQIISEMTVPKSMGKASDTLQENSAVGFEQVLEKEREQAGKEEELAKNPQPEQLPVDKAMLFYRPGDSIITLVSRMDVLAGTMQVQAEAPISQGVTNVEVPDNMARDMETTVSTAIGKDAGIEAGIKTGIQTPIETPIETGIQTPIETGKKTPVENPIETVLKPNVDQHAAVDKTNSKTIVPQEDIQPENTAKHEQKATENITEKITEKITENAVTLQADTATVTAAKVTATEKSAPAREPTMDYAASTPDKLDQHITKMIQSGKRQIEIQLQPEHLGKLVIKASYEAGKAMIAIVCTDTKTMNIMNQNASELADIIAARTGRSTEVVVDNAPVDYLEHQSQNQQEKDGAKQNQRDNRDKKQSDTTDFLQHLRLGLV